MNVPLPVALNTNRDNYVLSQGLAFASSAATTNFGACSPRRDHRGLLLVVYVIFQRQLQGSVSQGTMK